MMLSRTSELFKKDNYDQADVTQPRSTAALALFGAPGPIGTSAGQRICNREETRTLAGIGQTADRHWRRPVQRLLQVRLRKFHQAPSDSQRPFRIWHGC